MKALRIDDLGASSKAYEQWSRTRWANIGPFKRWRPWKAMGPYREMDGKEIDSLAWRLAEYHSRATLAITATWRDPHKGLIPYREKFPHQAEVIRHWVDRDVFEIAMHGYTHTNLAVDHRPRFWSGNRAAHREFVEASFPANDTRLYCMTELFYQWLGCRPTILVPPGFVFPYDTFKNVYGLRIWRKEWDVNVLALHDRDLVEGDGFERVTAALVEEWKMGRTLVACGDLDAL